MLSCRVQGKFIEQALIHHLVNMVGAETVEVFIDFRKTDRNRPAQLVLEEIGFISGVAGGYSLDPRQVDLSVPFMTVRTA
jgi:predicted enzyme involved in methoxymalonyl-ACP biosynthesis